MDWWQVETGVWLGFAVVAVPASALAAFMFVFRREPPIVDGQLIEASRRKAFDRIAEAKCGDERVEDLEQRFCDIAVDCIVEAYQVFNPDSTIKPKRLRRRFGANCLVVGNSAVLRMWFGRRFEGRELEAQNIPIDRELRLKRPAEPAPNGGGIKTEPPPKPQKPQPTQGGKPVLKQQVKR